MVLVLLNSSFTLVPLSFIEAVTLYSGAFVLVDTNTSTGIHYIEMMTLYSGVFVLVDTNTNTGIQLASCQAPPDKSGDRRIRFVHRRQRECHSQYPHRLEDSYQGWVPEMLV